MSGSNPQFRWVLREMVMQGDVRGGLGRAPHLTVSACSRWPELRHGMRRGSRATSGEMGRQKDRPVHGPKSA